MKAVTDLLRSAEGKRRLVMTLAGVLIAGFSVGLFNFSGFGMDPFQVFAHGLNNVIPLSYGLFYTLVNAVLLVVVFFMDKTKIGLGTMINLFLLGYVVDFSSALWNRLIPHPSVPVRAVFLILGIVIMCFASALYFTGDLGVSTYDAIALVLSKQRGWDFRITRISTDVICTVIGVLTGAVAGVGTIVTAFFMGPLIEFFNRTVARPLRYGSRK